MNKNKFFTSLYSFLTGVRINLVGQLYGSELLALLSFPSFSFKATFKKFPILSKVLFLYTILLGSLIFSDFSNGTNSSDYLRGWASILFSFFSLFFLVKNFDKSMGSVIYFLFFYSVSKMIFGESIELQSLEEENYFKANIVGFLNPLIIVVVYFLSLKSKVKPALVVLFLYGLINIIFDARSNSLAFFITFFLLLPKTYKIKINRKNMVVPIILVLMISYGMFAFYVNKVLSGEIGGSNAQQLTLAENPYNPFELLYYGRAGTFVSLEAIMEKPIIGHGSWVKDETGKYTLMMDAIMGTNSFKEEGMYIPAHSILLTSWLWAGILGFIAVLSLFLILIKLFMFIYKNEKKMHFLMIITIMFIDMVWNFLFSPFGHLRETIPQIVALLIVFSKDISFQKNTNQNQFKRKRQ